MLQVKLQYSLHLNRKAPIIIAAKKKIKSNLHLGATVAPSAVKK